MSEIPDIPGIPRKMERDQMEAYVRSIPEYKGIAFNKDAWNEMVRQQLHAPLLFGTGEQKKASRLRRRCWAISQRVSQIWYVARHGYSRY